MPLNFWIGFLELIVGAKFAASCEQYIEHRALHRYTISSQTNSIHISLENRTQDLP